MSSNFTCSTITLSDLLAQPEISEMGSAIQLSCVNGKLNVVDTNTTILAEVIEVEGTVTIAGTDEPPADAIDNFLTQIVVDNALVIEAGVYEAIYDFQGKVEYVELVPTTGVETVKQTNYVKYSLDTFIDVVDATTINDLTDATSQTVALGQVDNTPAVGVTFTYTAADQTLTFGYTAAEVITGLTNARTLITRVSGTRSYKLVKLS